MNIWQHIEHLVNDKIEHSFVLHPFSASTSVSLTGQGNQTFTLRGNKRKYFLKVNHVSCENMFRAEADGLSYLSALSGFKIPEVIACGVFLNNSFILMECLSLGYSGNIRDFAQLLASLHTCSEKAFGFSDNNFIGLTPQLNHWSESWIDFFVQNRLEFQLKNLKSADSSSILTEKGQLLIDRVADFFISYKPVPALIHGDLWDGNYSFDPAGTPLIYDPACYYADHEAELAMLELFGNPGKAFWQAYQELHPIDIGYSQRRDLYNLYHILNHANLFGGSYYAQAERMIDQLLNQLRFG